MAPRPPGQCTCLPVHPLEALPRGGTQMMVMTGQLGKETLWMDTLEHPK